MPSVSSRIWATSFCFSSAVAMLPTANSDSATIAAPAPARIRRGLGSRCSPSRRHHRRIRPVRIGVSMNRYEISVIGTVIAIASTN